MRLYHSLVEESGEYVAFKCMNLNAYRTSLTIPYPLWKALLPEIQQAIQETRERIQGSQVQDARPVGRSRENPLASTH